MALSAAENNGDTARGVMLTQRSVQDGQDYPIAEVEERRTDGGTEISEGHAWQRTQTGQKTMGKVQKRQQ